MSTALTGRTHDRTDRLASPIFPLHRRARPHMANQISHLRRFINENFGLAVRRPPARHGFGPKPHFSGPPRANKYGGQGADAHDRAGNHRRGVRRAKSGVSRRARCARSHGPGYRASHRHHARCPATGRRAPNRWADRTRAAGNPTPAMVVVSGAIFLCVLRLAQGWSRTGHRTSSSITRQVLHPYVASPVRCSDIVARQDRFANVLLSIGKARGGQPRRRTRLAR